MANRKFSQFDELLDAQITLDTELTTSVPGGALALGNYRFTLSQLIDFISSRGFIKVIDGQYTSDAAAITSGGTVGDYYRVAPGHVDGYPSDGGIIKRIMS